MNEGFFAFLLGLAGLVIVSSLIVRVRVRKIMDDCGSVVPSTEMTGRGFIEEVLESEGMNEIEVEEGEDLLSGGYFFRRGMVKVPDLKSSSLLVLGVAAHEISHAVQAKYRPLSVKVTSILGDFGMIFSYLFPLFLVFGLLLYFPLLYIGLGIYLSILLVVLVEVPVEVDAMRKAVGYLDSYAQLREDELAKLKKLLRWAILTRISYLTGAFLVLFTFGREVRQ